jgi:hypothetical protein
MNFRLPILMGFLVSLCFYFIQPYPCLSQHSPNDPLFLLAKNEEGVSVKEVLQKDPAPAIEEYEKEKLAKLKKNIGRRLLAVKTINPAAFYEAPDVLAKKLNIKREKEGFVIMEVVQNQLGTMNFYQVKFDTDQIGYLSADGNYLQIKIKEGSIISVSRKTTAKKKDLNQSKALASRAIELVKDHLTLTDPVTGAKRSVEKRMMDQKISSFPNLKWRYEAKEIRSNQYRVTQNAGEGAGPPLIRTWMVDLSTMEVKPENLAAKELYR